MNNYCYPIHFDKIVANGSNLLCDMVLTIAKVCWNSDNSTPRVLYGVKFPP